MRDYECGLNAPPPRNPRAVLCVGASPRLAELSAPSRAVLRDGGTPRPNVPPMAVGSSRLPLQVASPDDMLDHEHLWSTMEGNARP